MYIAVAGEDIDLVAINTERGFLHALAELVNPFRFAGEGVQAIEQRRIAGTNIDTVAGDGRRRQPATVFEGPMNFG